MIKPFPRRTGVILMFAVAITTGLAGTAHASAATPTVSLVTTSTEATVPVSLPNFNDNVNLSTRSWSTTTLCVSNVGSQYGLLRVQALRPNATPEFIELQPNTTKCVDRWWSGVLVNAMNVSSSALSVRTY